MTMEFRYKLNPWKKRSYWLVPLGTLLLALAYFVVFSEFLIGDLIWLFGFNGFFLYAIIKTYQFYRKADSMVIRLDDLGISHESNGNIVAITWKDVTNVSWEQTPFIAIVIKSERNQITIGKEINGFAQIIQTTKQMVGNRFITHDIPWELKYPKAK